MPKFSTRYRHAFSLLALGALAQGALAVDLNDSGITSFRVLSPSDTATLVKTPQGWVLKRDAFPARVDAIRQALEGIHALRKQSRPIPAKEARSDGSTPRSVEWTDASGKKYRADLVKTLFVDRFENDPARIRVDTAENGHENVWVVGEDSTVWKKPGSPKAWLAHGSFGWASARALDWKDRSLSRIGNWESIRALTVDWKDADGKQWHYKVERDASKTRLVEPLQGELAYENTQHLLLPISQLVIDGFVEGPVDSAWGLHDPSMTLRIEEKDGRLQVLHVGNAVGTMRYVQHPRHPQAVRLLDARLAPLRQRPEEILTPMKVDTSDLEDTFRDAPSPLLPHKH
jgi:hypothetical protein